MATTQKAIQIDLSKSTWLLPCSILLLSNAIDYNFSRGVSVGILKPKDQKLEKYLTEIGFPLGKVKYREGSAPILHFTKDVNANAADLYEFVNETFPRQLAGNPVNTLIGEMADNIDQHSQFTHASLMAQHFPSKNMVDIGIFDNGISIPGNFKKNGIKFENDSDAIIKAITGVSTKKDENRRGRGLPFASKFTTQGLNGNFYLFSGDGAIELNASGTIQPYNLTLTSTRGTLVYMRFKNPGRNLDPNLIYKYT
jgi:hypothetical protein